MAITFCEDGISGTTNMTHIWRTIGGGTVFSANLIGTEFAFFEAGASANDAIYFCWQHSSNYYLGSTYATLGLSIKETVAGTNMVLVWEYYCRQLGRWIAVSESGIIIDNTNYLTITGVNKVRFGRFAFQTTHSDTINGVSLIGFSIRCRLISGSISNGGLHNITLPKVYDGNIYVEGYTDVSPATLYDVYNSLSVNYPECGIKKLGNVNSDVYGEAYELPNATINTSKATGYFSTQNNYLKLGNGSQCYTSIIGGRWVDGKRVGDMGFFGSKIVLASSIGTNFNGALSGLTKYYGTNFSTGRYAKIIEGILVHGANGAGYLSMGTGEYIGCSTYNLGLGYWVGDGEIKNCFMYTTGVVAYPIPATMRIKGLYIGNSGVSTSIFMLYDGGYTGGYYESVNWQIDSGYLFKVNTNMTVERYFKFLNPIPAFPTDNSGTKKLVDLAGNGSIAKWNIQEYYSFNLSVNDGTSSIQSATVTLKDKNGTQVFSVQTDANGTIVTQNVLRLHAYYSSGLVSNEMNPFTLTISKVGFETYMSKLTIISRFDETISLKPVIPTRYTFEGKPFRALLPEAGSSSQLIEL